MLICPECGAEMVLRETTKYTYNNGDPRKFYGCSTWPACQATHGAHPDGKPLGVPANKETKAARMAAHAAFDGYWQSLGYDKNRAYKLLREIMEMTPKEAHIANFDKATCELLVARVQERIKGADMLRNLKGITFSGPDCNTPIGTLVEMQRKFPHMEVGVLWSLSRAGQPRYADRVWIEEASQLGLKFALHLCGKVARKWVEEGEVPEIPGKPSRIQINCNGMDMLSGWWKGMEILQSQFDNGLEFIVQVCDATGAYCIGLARGADGHKVTPLFDKSGGKGVLATEWPKALPGVRCGYAGGINPLNVVEVAKAVHKVAGEFWLDMESGIRTGDTFDMNHVAHVLQQLDPLIVK